VYDTAAHPRSVQLVTPEDSRKLDIRLALEFVMGLSMVIGRMARLKNPRRAQCQRRRLRSE
jgi:hypothetical protein